MLDQVTSFGVISLTNCITTIILGSLAFLKGKKSGLKTAYAVFAYSLAFYAFFYFLWQSSSQEKWSVLFFKWTIVGVVLINTAFLNFVYVLIGIRAKHKIRLVAAHVANLFFCWAAIYTFYQGWAVKYSYGLWPIPSITFHIYLAWWFAQVVHCFYLIVLRGVRIGSEKEKLQCKWVLVASLIGYIGGATNWFVWYGINFPPYANIGVAFYALILGYAVLRHRLLDIDVVIKKTVTFAGVFAMAMLVVSIVSTVTQGYLGQYIKVGNNISTLLSVLIAIVLYKPTHGFLIRVTDKFLFQRKQEIKVTLNRLSEQVTSIADVDQIAKTILSTLKDAMRLESGMMILQNKKQSNYHIAEHFGFAGDDLTQSIRAIVKDPLIVKYFSDRGSVVNLDYHAISELPKHVFDWLDAAKVRVVIPLFVNDDKFGMMVLGKKRSDQEFKQEEIEYFPVIASQTSLAIRNALLIQDVVYEREAKVRAEHLAERVKFARTIKHEVKNALAGIEGPARFLSMYHTPDLKKAFKEKDEEWFDEICAKINKQVSEKIYKGVEKVFDIAETSLGGLDEEDQSLRRIYFKILWDEAKEESGILKKCDFESTIPDGFIIYGKYHALQRVLVNLITNAFDAMRNQDKKSICLKCSYEEVDGQSIASFEFRDSGPGIPKEAHTKVFEQGFSTKPKPDSQDRLASGYGQGLYVCKTTIEKMHSGKMWIENVEGQGAIFKFWLPMKGAAGAE